jgi:hypothetical protein
MQELPDEFDIIECCELQGCELQIGEMTKRQMKLYLDMRVNVPTSLQ